MNKCITLVFILKMKFFLQCWQQNGHYRKSVINQNILELKIDSEGDSMIGPEGEKLLILVHFYRFSV